MNFYGFQKMTLLDFPGRVACTLFTGGCNFRCPFCHNAVLVVDVDDGDVYPEEEILAFLRKRAGLLDGVAVTGGEPLLWKELPAFLRKVRALGYQIKLDTNGSFPDRLRAMVGEGLLDYVAVDIKNSKEKYAQTVGLADFDLSPVEETVRFLKTGAVPYEFRTTVVRELHTAEDIDRIGRWIEGAEHYYLQNFTDSGNLLSDGLSAHDRKTLDAMLETARKYVPDAGLRGV